MKRRSLTGPIVKSLIFVLVTGLATAVLAISIAGASVGDTVGYNARFTDTTGLTSGDSIRIAGVRVGQVDSIKVVDRRYAQVHFSVQRSRALPASTNATIKYLNMVGQRYIDLTQGTGPVGGVLHPGATIPLQRTAPALDLTQLFNGFQPLFQGLSPKDVNQLAGEIVQVLQGEGGTVDGLVSSVGSLTTTLAAKDQVIGKVIDNLNSVLTTVNTRETGFNDLVATLQQLVSGFAQDREPIGQSITAISRLTTSTAGLLDAGRRPLKDSIAQLGRLSTNLADNSPQLEDFLKTTPQKFQAIGRTASYGSWLNLYLCQATVSGVSTFDGSKAPTGIAITEARCRS
ncbi:MCE family protein [Actinacidiphila rubida]|uniref:Phospholipid/cholesterol/gamma-HCH transport system substrate-binding protein n=1 Tax=Actinacidiphila rubida TaxID=310780 RepID=A0A1H8N8R9_9ACTN|nr:MCE family protein [Actinacidiphila rubida]SEO25936.1 phospholipid/cholesterol/gamma-HCH transport system substrate-binding protein [Actinacidiphila rubida]